MSVLGTSLFLMNIRIYYDNASARGIKNPIWWQSTVTSAGNLTSVIYRAFGQSFSKEDKRLLNVPFAQFVKLNTEFRHLWNMDKNNAGASRMALGARLLMVSNDSPIVNNSMWVVPTASALLRYVASARANTIRQKAATLTSTRRVLSVLRQM